MNVMPYTKLILDELPEEFELALFKVFKKINKKYGVTYMSYTFDKLNFIRYSFRTDSAWASLYHHEKLNGKPLIENCPLDVVSRQNHNQFLIWDMYNQRCQPKIYREIMGMREDMGLMHGLTLNTYFGQHHDALAVATEDKKNDLAINLLLNEKSQALQSFLIECRKIAIKYVLKAITYDEKIKKED